MREPFAERKLIYRATGSDIDEPLAVRFGRPLPSQTHPALLECEFEIEGPGDHYYAAKVFGSDGMQTIAFAISVLNGLIDAVRRDGSVTWDGSELAARLPFG